MKWMHLGECPDCILIVRLTRWGADVPFGRKAQLQGLLAESAAVAPSENWSWASSVAADLLWRLADVRDWAPPECSRHAAVPVLQRTQSSVLTQIDIRDFAGVEQGKGACAASSLDEFARQLQGIGFSTTDDWLRNQEAVREGAKGGAYRAAFRAWDAHLSWDGNRNHHFAALYRQATENPGEFALSLNCEVSICRLVDRPDPTVGLSHLLVLERTSGHSIRNAVESVDRNAQLEWYSAADPDVMLIGLRQEQWFAPLVAAHVQASGPATDLLQRYDEATSIQRRELLTRGWFA